MAEKHPVIHPFFSMEKRKEVETTEHEEIIDLSASNDEKERWSKYSEFDTKSLE